MHWEIWDPSTYDHYGCTKTIPMYKESPFIVGTGTKAERFAYWPQRDWVPAPDYEFGSRYVYKYFNF